MTIKARDLPMVLVERIEDAHPAHAMFASGEVDGWPAGALMALQTQTLLGTSNRAQAIDCPGCELRCNKEVEVRQAGMTNRAFIVCNEEPDLGRIAVKLTSLQVFETDLRRISTFVANALQLGPPRASPNRGAYSLGCVKGRNGTRPISIGIKDGRIVVNVGLARTALVEVLGWRDTGLIVDQKHLRRLADRKEPAVPDRRDYAADRSRQADRKQATRKRDQLIFREAKRRHSQGDVTWSAVANDLAGSSHAPDLSSDRVRRIISTARAGEREKSRSKSKKRK